MRRLTIVVVVAVCAVAGCTRIFGGVVGKGEHSWQVSGARQASGSGVAIYQLFGSGSLQRGPYMLNLFQGTDTSLANISVMIAAPLGLTTGRHDVATYYVRPPHDSDFSVDLDLENVGFHGDSGVFNVTTEGRWVKGDFRVFLSPRDTAKSTERLVLTGSFKVR